MRKIAFLLAAVLGLVAATSACGSVGTYAAKVNGVAITQRHLDDELNAIKANKKYLDSIEQQLAQQGERATGSGKGTFDTAFVARVLTRQILLEIVHQGVVKRHLKITDNDRKTADDQLKQSFGQDVSVLNSFSKSYRAELVQRNAEVNVLQASLSGTKVTDEAIKQFYDQNQSQFAQVCSRHILAEVPQDHTPTPAEDAAAKAKADSWKARLDKGEDFAAIAKAESQDPGSAPQGGDLGCQSPDQMVAGFKEALNTLPLNQISAPVKTSFGYHIIQVTQRKTVSLADATPQIRQQLESQNSGAINDYLDKNVGKAKIVVNPRYGHFDKNAQQPGVVPPGLPATTTTAPDAGAAGQPGQVPGADTGGAGSGSGAGSSQTPGG